MAIPYKLIINDSLITNILSSTSSDTNRFFTCLLEDRFVFFLLNSLLNNATNHNPTRWKKFKSKIMKSVIVVKSIIVCLLFISCNENKSKNNNTVDSNKLEIEAIEKPDTPDTELKTAKDNLKIIKAFGEDGINVDWKKIEQEYLAEELEYGGDGPGYFYNDCGQGINVIQISSQLSNQSNSSYGKEHLTDDNPNTAWVEGKSDYGIGEYFITKGFCPNTIYNGYQNSPTNWKNNSRVKRFKLYINNKAYAYVDLTDEMGAQRFDGPSGEYEGTDEFKFEIVEVYKGEKSSDVAISHIDYVACCFALETEISSANKRVTKENLKEGDNIYTVDIITGAVSEGLVQKISSEKHVNLVELNTNTHSIKVTKNHPLYFEDIGFISLERLQKRLNSSDYLNISDYPRVLTMDNNTDELVYEKIVSIKKLNEIIETYTIRKISDNSNYIANGFVCKPY